MLGCGIAAKGEGVTKERGCGGSVASTDDWTDVSFPVVRRAHLTGRPPRSGSSGAARRQQNPAYPRQLLDMNESACLYTSTYSYSLRALSKVWGL